jgi:hypothetical protein
MCHACCKGFTFENLPRLLQRFYSIFINLPRLLQRFYLLKFSTFVAKVLLLKIRHASCKGFTFENLPRLFQGFTFENLPRLFQGFTFENLPRLLQRFYF